MTKIDMSRILRDPDMVFRPLQMMAADLAAIRRLLECQPAPDSVIRNSRTTDTLRYPADLDGAHHVAEPRDLVMGRRK